MGGNRGFTLIEILIALTITSILMVVLYVSFKKVVDTIHYIEIVRSMAIMDRMLTINLDKDLSTIFYEKKYNTKKKGLYFFYGNNVLDRREGQYLLDFFSTNSLFLNNTSSYPVINRISYFLKKKSDRYLLYRSEVPYANIQNIVHHKEAVQIALYIKDIRIFFFNQKGKKFLSWNSTLMNNSLPSLVKLHIKFEYKGNSYCFEHTFYLIYNDM